MTTSNRRSEKVAAAERLALLNEFVSRYRTRIVEGLPKYGEFDRNNDPRILCDEAAEEFLDGGGSYMEMLEQSWPELEPDVRVIRAKSIVIYGLLKKLRVKEVALRAKRTLTREGD
jgi:hypothetical protein